MENSHRACKWFPPCKQTETRPKAWISVRAVLTPLTFDYYCQTEKHNKEIQTDSTCSRVRASALWLIILESVACEQQWIWDGTTAHGMWKRFSAKRQELFSTWMWMEEVDLPANWTEGHSSILFPLKCSGFLLLPFLCEPLECKCQVVSCPSGMGTCWVSSFGLRVQRCIWTSFNQEYKTRQLGSLSFYYLISFIHLFISYTFLSCLFSPGLVRLNYCLEI